MICYSILDKKMLSGENPSKTPCPKSRIIVCIALLHIHGQSQGMNDPILFTPPLHAHGLIRVLFLPISPNLE